MRDTSERVNISPMPDWARGTRYKPMPPPLFAPGVSPTPDDIELARALFEELDPESKRWYSHGEKHIEKTIFAGLALD